MKKLNYVIVTHLIAVMVLIPRAEAVDVNQYPVLKKLVKTMSTEDGYPERELIAVLKKAKVDQKTLDLMNRQYEALPWHKYRKLFINQNRINEGVRFWSEHQAVLDKAYKEYGIPQSIIVALVGIETHYGQRMGDKRVLDSLVTLSADFPRRSKFFTRELRTFLNTTRNENIDPVSVLGSFAGAIGIPQFMPTSYEAYAIDFNGNQQRDLVNEFEDAIGSIANYLSVHGWEPGQSIYANIENILSEEAEALVTKRAKPTLSHDQLKAAHVVYDDRKSSKEMALLRLKEENQHRYIVGYRNFYAITRYNPSVNYAMAVIELAEAIEQSVNS